MSPGCLSPDSCRLPAVAVGQEFGLWEKYRKREAERHMPRAPVERRKPGLYQGHSKEV